MASMLRRSFVAAVVVGALAPASALAQEPSATEGTFLDETVEVSRTAASTETCTAPELSNPLAGFKDHRDYFVAPGGDFEAGAEGWQLEGGARVVAGNEPFFVMGAGHARSLALPPGSSATSPEMCVDLNYPTFRFLLAQVQADDDHELAVDVIYPALEKNNVREAKHMKAKHAWKLTKDIKLEPQRLGKQSGWRKVALRFRAEDGDSSGEIVVDNILIDPRARA